MIGNAASRRNDKVVIATAIWGNGRFMAKRRFFCAGAYPALQRTLFLSAFVPGAVNRIESVRLDVAGKAVNAARALQRLGGNPVLGGFSGGSSGRDIEALLQAEGLDCEGVLSVDAAVRICQTILPKDGSPFTELVEEGPRLAAADWDALAQHCCACLRMAAGYGAVILAGTMPEHASMDFYPELMHAAQAPVILDTSGPALHAALPARPDIVKIKADELRGSFQAGAGDDIVALAGRMLAGGAVSVGITQGAHTAFLVTHEGAWAYKIPAVQAVSALGSGDCVNAGLAFGLAEVRPLVDAFAFGLACGTANAEVAHPGGIDPDRVATLLPMVRRRAL